MPCERFEGLRVLGRGALSAGPVLALGLCGGRPAGQGQVYAWTTPRDQEGAWLRPGGNAGAFTRAAVDMLESLCFHGPQQAWELAVRYLARQGNDASQWALHLLRLVTLPRPDPDEGG